MPLIELNDIELHKNVGLTVPNGETIAQDLIDALIAWAQSRCGYTFAAGARSAAGLS